jgi:hypothetical protein
MSDIKDIRIEEYKSLIEEHKKNRSYIFERPLLITGTIAISIQYFCKTEISQFVLLFILLIVCFNLWFTAHRFQSSARIVAYLQLFHEREFKDKWIGWENALR